MEQQEEEEECISSAETSPSLSPKNALLTMAGNMDEAYKSSILSFPNLKLLECHGQIRELQTIIRNKSTTRNEFIFCADRLIRIVVEQGLDCIPTYECTVTTPTGMKYTGVKFEKMTCAVSIVRSGEAMEKGMRDCFRSICIGKILIKRDTDTNVARVYYAKFPSKIEHRTVLLLYPVLETGATVKAAVKVLKDHGVQEKNIVFVNLFSSFKGVESLLKKYPEITMLTSEVHEFCPNHFGQKYFGVS
ncbi:PREDICTED: uracil phosphoribosyltransferase homolog [Amphimedon queenslandica]|uniref:Uracil phosphoribosyltransferase homolog n=1 Tax=Amphimedon queenslandica TaxID=400682 RepID=A0A1X7VIP1_AMPQE|nr:PREDICTED: uracil phosphoribosyltransferase homolog [Amphimedon queenslandica]|eukprot:XP_003384070.2 PREDICTED: uracil phosphoribosyltransferase homolog [Amphimedon queenslandica]